jgi:hypothetical protein
MFSVLVGGGAAIDSRPSAFEKTALRNAESTADSTVVCWVHQSDAMAQKRTLENLGQFLRDAQREPYPALLHWVRHDARKVHASDLAAMRIAKMVWDDWSSVRINRVANRLEQHTCDQLMVLGAQYINNRAGMFFEAQGATDPASVRYLVSDFRPFYDDHGMVPARRLCKLLRPDNIRVIRQSSAVKPLLDDIKPVGSSVMIEYRARPEDAQP